MNLQLHAKEGCKFFSDDLNLEFESLFSVFLGLRYGFVIYSIRRVTLTCKKSIKQGLYDERT